MPWPEQEFACWDGKAVAVSQLPVSLLLSKLYQNQGLPKTAGLELNQL